MVKMVKINKLFVYFIVIVLAFLLVLIIRPGKASAERNTQAVCRYGFTANGSGTLPGNRRYVVFEYAVRGNDNARRFFAGAPLNRWWTENGWYVNSASLFGSPGCSPVGNTGFWNGTTVNLATPEYSWVFGGGRPDSVYLGLPNGATFVPQDNYNIPGIGDADNGARALLGIDKVPLDVFATLNDGGVAQVGPGVAWCLGMNTSPHGCGNVDSGNVYNGGGDFAGYQNGGNFAAKPRRWLVRRFWRLWRRLPHQARLGKNPFLCHDNICDSLHWLVNCHYFNLHNVFRKRYRKQS